MALDNDSSAAAFADWIASSLLFFGVSDEAFTEYILQICTEDSIPMDEKQEIITEFLAESLEVSVVKWIEELLERNQRMLEAVQLQADEQRQKNLDAQKKKEQELLQQTSLKTDQPRCFKANMLSKEDKRARDRLLKKYGYDMDEEVEEAGEVHIVYKDTSTSSSATTDLGAIGRSRNVNIIKEQEQAKKLKAQAEHQKVQARNKEMREKQALEKEKEKERRRTPKEKRRM
ncbi:hypothetical protein QVD99_000388 [Batrachochytrium dendrobatidis]|nr:hypothetical protein QVD99_000388 [Batrachochytrium dendrobatidis]